MKGLVIYASCYGSTKQYAEWISAETGFECYESKDVTDEQLREAEIIVIGSWVIAYKLFLSKWIEEKKELLTDKKLYFYSVSGAMPGDESLKGVFTKSVNESLLSGATTYEFAGRREIKKMSAFHKFMLWIASTFIEKDPVKKQEMKKYVDNVDKKYIEALLRDIKGI